VSPKVIQIAISSGFDGPNSCDDGAVYLLYDNGDVYFRYNSPTSDWLRVGIPILDEEGNVE
jgi:hypothetical protein